MSKTEKYHKITVFEPPLPEKLLNEILDFWGTIFQTDYEPFRGIFRGDEAGQNRDILYLVEKGGKIVSTCHLTIAESNPELGGLGEIGTTPDYRGKGIASLLCEHARDDFQRFGGQVLFLGTVNPAAARLYYRLGWRKLAGANVMAFVKNGQSPEAFIEDYFKGGGAVTVETGSAAGRIPMIPLIVSPHEWQVMDANVAIFSTRYVDQDSCMGLYPRYASLDKNGKGTWFSARSDRNHLVGLATAHLDDSGGCLVDGFTHLKYQDTWDSLIAASISRAIACKASYCRARVSGEDGEKISRFETLGFDKVGQDEPITLGTREVTSVRLERRIR